MGVKEKYKLEIGYIIRDLKQIESGHFTEATGNKSAGCATTIAKNIRETFIDLMNKIETNDKSDGEKISGVWNKNSKELSEGE